MKFNLIIWFCVFTLLLSFVSAVDDSIFYLSFDSNNTNAYDYGSNHNNMTITGATYTTSSYRGTGAFFFDADGDYGLSYPSWTIPNTVTVSMWINAKDLTGTGGYTPRLMHYVNGTAKIMLSVDNTGIVTFHYIHSNTSSYGLKNVNAINLNTWYNLVGVYNGQNVQIYVNGVYDTSANTNSPSGGTSGQLFLGGRATTNGLFNGTIDSIRIYNRNLSVTEIQQLYTCNSSYTWTSWFNVSQTSGILNQSRIYYDTTNCWFANANITEYRVITIIDSTSGLSTVADNILTFSDDLQEVLAMIGGILLFLGLWFLAYHMIQTGNMYMGWGMLLLSIPLDIFLSVMFQESNFLGSGFLGIAFSVMAAFTLPAMILIKRKVIIK